VLVLAAGDHAQFLAHLEGFLAACELQLFLCGDFFVSASPPQLHAAGEWDLEVHARDLQVELVLVGPQHFEILIINILTIR
jgi:hypothetical protein